MELGVWEVKVAGTLRQSIEEEVLLRERSGAPERAPLNLQLKISARVQRNYQWPGGKKPLKGLERTTFVDHAGLGRVQVAISQNRKTSGFMGYLLERSVVGGH